MINNTLYTNDSEYKSAIIYSALISSILTNLCKLMHVKDDNKQNKKWKG